MKELNEISSLVAGIGNANLFAVPEGYFGTVVRTVMLCLKEENNTGIEGVNVPAGYFEGVSNNILSKIQGTVANELQEISPLLTGIIKENFFKVPEHYFEQLPADIISKLNAEEVPAILLNVKDLQPFTLPVGYFDNISGDILSKVHQVNRAKVITMPKRRNLILKYAAAAMFTGVVALGVYKFANTSAVLAPVIEQGIAIAADENKFNETLGNLDTEAITRYLEKNASETDVALLTSEFDEGTLPAQEEYLTDEETLDNFIEEISSKN
ncbi:MAG: hypothetical protein IPP72_12475 [Chitinophagaceae bacterium]|nr:hypothetical protein [Chitinophagaceae bacterium]